MRTDHERETIDKAEKVVVPHDPVNEQVLLAAALVDQEARRHLVGKHSPDQFIAPSHHALWAVVREAQHRQLGVEPATLQQLARTLGLEVDVRYVADLIAQRPNPPASLGYHSECLVWDHARVTAAAGPVAELLHALRDPSAQPDRVRGLARAVGASLDASRDRAYLLDPEALVRDQTAEIRLRRDGRATYPFGVEGLDVAEDGRPRLVPGAAPGMVTVVTGCSGSGKSPFLTNLVLGLARQRRKVLYGAWEVRGGMTLEWLAIIALGYDRAAFQLGEFTDEQLVALEAMMLKISRYVRFMANPFRRGRQAETQKRRSGGNDKNLDVVHGYIADSGCDVFVADLWERCLVDSDPDEEKKALFRMQAMAEEQRCHMILVAQQRLKDIEQRPDKRPTREGIKGSSAWVEVADNILGTHRPALGTRVPDEVLNVVILKQRYGKWPSMLAFDWSPLRYSIGNGREVPYDTVGEAEGTDEPFSSPVKKGGRKPYGGGRPRGDG